MSVTRNALRLSILVVAMVILMTGLTNAHSPSPETKARLKAEGKWNEFVENMRAFEAAQNPDMYERSRELHLSTFKQSTALSVEAVDTVNICVILVDFPDYRYFDTSYFAPEGTISSHLSATPAMFDSLLFSQQSEDLVYNPSGSMTEFYLETSYGQYFVKGDVFGWYTAPNNYSYYVGDSDGLGGGGRILAHDAVVAADAGGVDFSPYGNGSSIVPGVVIVHAGPGAEAGSYGIWSHRSDMSPSYPTDGVWLGAYTMQPEENYGGYSMAHVGVYCHEWGHVLGLPDWYDVAYNDNSEGLGDWCVMAGGSWNQGGQVPSHFNCYSKFLVGFNDMVWLDDNLDRAPIIQSVTSPIAYALKDNPVPGEGSINTWFVENRQQVGFDRELPGDGLLIYHFNGAQADQTNPPNYRLALEQADGMDQMATAGSDGDWNDPFPGQTVNVRDFHDWSTPSSRTYGGALTEVGVWDISDSDSLMYADLMVYYARPYLLLDGDSISFSDVAGGDGDGILEQGETIDIYIEVANMMKMSYDPQVTMTVSNPELSIVQYNRSMGISLNPSFSATNHEPLQIYIPDDFRSARVTFSLSITSDTLYNSVNDGIYETVFEFDQVIGRPQVMLISSSDNVSDQRGYSDAFDRMGIPIFEWNTDSQGSPSSATMANFATVIWMTGYYYPPPLLGAQLVASDVAAMKEYLDAGGNLMLASVSAPAQLLALDSAFMATYLHANLTGSESRRTYLGRAENPVGDGMLYVTRSGVLWDEVTPSLDPVNGGLPAFTMTNTSGAGDYGNCGVTYDGNYRTIFLSFPVEFISVTGVEQGYMPTDTLLSRVLDFFMRGSATGVEDDDYLTLLPNEFSLNQNYPNPFNPSTTIRYSIGPGESVATDLSIFNVLGQKVTTLVNKVQSSGDYEVNWDGRSSSGQPAATGVYFYRLTRGDQTESKKMMLLK